MPADRCIEVAVDHHEAAIIACPAISPNGSQNEPAKLKSVSDIQQNYSVYIFCICCNINLQCAVCLKVARQQT